MDACGWQWKRMRKGMRKRMWMAVKTWRGNVREATCESVGEGERWRGRALARESVGEGGRQGGKEGRRDGEAKHEAPNA